MSFAPAQALAEAEAAVARGDIVDAAQWIGRALAALTGDPSASGDDGTLRSELESRCSRLDHALRRQREVLLEGLQGTGRAGRALQAYERVR